MDLCVCFDKDLFSTRIYIDCVKAGRKIKVFFVNDLDNKTDQKGKLKRSISGEQKTSRIEKRNIKSSELLIKSKVCVLCTKTELYKYIPNYIKLPTKRKKLFWT